MNSRSTFLFARPSYLEGLARIMDFGNTITVYNESLNGEQADYLALRSDWTAVGDDLRSAIQQFDAEMYASDRAPDDVPE